MSRIFMGTDTSFAFSGQINVDFDTISQPPIQYVAPAGDSGIWDTADWDLSVWGGNIYPVTRWVPATKIGHYGSYRIRTSSNNADVRYYSTDYVFEGGGVL